MEFTELQKRDIRATDTVLILYKNEVGFWQDWCRCTPMEGLRALSIGYIPSLGKGYEFKLVWWTNRAKELTELDLARMAAIKAGIDDGVEALIDLVNKSLVAHIHDLCFPSSIRAGIKPNLREFEGTMEYVSDQIDYKDSDNS